MEIPWYINRHTLISRKRDGKPRMIGGYVIKPPIGKIPASHICSNIFEDFTSMVKRKTVIKASFSGSLFASRQACNGEFRPKHPSLG